MLSNLLNATKSLVSNWRIFVMGLVVSAFEGSMFCFVFNWTPALDSDTLPPPHGLIFALFMMACMCGASAFTLFGSSMRPSSVMMPTLIVAALALAMVAAVTGLQYTYAP